MISKPLGLKIKIGLKNYFQDHVCPDRIKMKNKPVLNVYVSYEEHTHIDKDDFNSDDFSGSTETHTESRLTCVTKEAPSGVYNTLVSVKDWDGKLDVEEVHVVCVQYSTGGTFSFESGRLAFEGAYVSHKEAEKIAKSIRNETYKDYGPWVGYFESVEDIYIQTESLIKRSKKVHF